jgi:hypothetical protein
VITDALDPQRKHGAGRIALLRPNAASVLEVKTLSVRELRR